MYNIILGTTTRMSINLHCKSVDNIIMSIGNNDSTDLGPNHVPEAGENSRSLLNVATFTDSDRSPNCQPIQPARRATQHTNSSLAGQARETTQTDLVTLTNHSSSVGHGPASSYPPWKH